MQETNSPKCRVTAGQTNSVLIENNGADGIVNVDAVQVLRKRME